MKKILFAAYSLDVGGIETALVTLINYLAKKDYKITLVLEKKEGIFLDSIDKSVKIIQYTPSTSGNKVLNKSKNAVKRINFVTKYKNKFDAAISFATYSLPCSFISRTASNNNVLWVHNNYLAFFDYDENKYMEFFNKLNVSKFKKIVFVSEESKRDFEKRFTNIKAKLIVCNNLIDYKQIEEKSNKKISDYNKKSVTFLNIGRHDEKQKKLIRLIEAARILNEKGLDFSILLVGSGKDTKKYLKKIKEYNLEDKIEFLGIKKNPYPYFKISDYVVLTSDYEGYPVVYVESMILNKPILTTDVSDSLEEIQNKYGIVCKKDEEDIAKNMEILIKNGFEIKNKFDPEDFNNKIKNKIENEIL